MAGAIRTGCQHLIRWMLMGSWLIGVAGCAFFLKERGFAPNETGPSEYEFGSAKDLSIARAQDTVWHALTELTPQICCPMNLFWYAGQKETALHFINRFDYYYDNPYPNPYVLDVEGAGSRYHPEFLLLRIAFQAGHVPSVEHTEHVNACVLRIVDDRKNEKKDSMESSVAWVMQHLNENDRLNYSSEPLDAALDTATLWIERQATKGSRNRIAFVVDPETEFSQELMQRLQAFNTHIYRDDVLCSVLIRRHDPKSERENDISALKNRLDCEIVMNDILLKKILWERLTGTDGSLLNSAGICIHFNPDSVKSYRLVGGLPVRSPGSDASGFSQEEGEIILMDHTSTYLFEIQTLDQKNLGDIRITYRTNQSDDLLEQTLPIDRDAIKFKFSQTTPAYQLAVCAAEYFETKSWKLQDRRIVLEKTIATLQEIEPGWIRKNDIRQLMGDIRSVLSEQ